MEFNQLSYTNGTVFLRQLQYGRKAEEFMYKAETKW
jgi:hypothetical protein